MDFLFLLLASWLIYAGHSLTSFYIALVIFERLNYNDIQHIQFLYLKAPLMYNTMPFKNQFY